MQTLRNVVTGETIEVESGSREYAALRKETYDHEGTIKPKWEASSAAHADRMDSGDVTEEDVGYQHKPFKNAPALDKSQLIFGRRKKRLTPAEVKNGITSHEQKEKELADMFGKREDSPERVRKTAPARREVEGKAAAGRSQKTARGRSRSSASSSGSGSSSPAGGSGDGSEGTGSGEGDA